MEHRIRHYVVLDGELHPRESAMRGAWACEAKCSCGWETRTGGAVKSYIDRMVADHKSDVRHGFWTPDGAVPCPRCGYPDGAADHPCSNFGEEAPE